MLCVGLNQRVCDMNLAGTISFSLLVLALVSAMVALHVATEELYHDERNDLIQLRESLSSTMNLHSNWTGPPCHNDHSRWFGITCLNSHVVGIDLEGIQLIGSLPPTALQSVTYLTNLSLRNNALHGGLPNLKGLVHLQFVSFARNRISGSIPAEFVALPSLTELELQDNLLNGTIPSFDQQTLTVLNVSYNFLEGQIPETSVLQRFPTSSFDHNLELCGKPLDTPCVGASLPVHKVPPSQSTGGAPPPSSSLSRNKRLKQWNVALIAAGSAMVTFMIVMCFLSYYKRYQRKSKRKGDYSGEASIGFVEKAEKGSSSISEPDLIAELEFFDKRQATFDLDSLLRSSAEVMGRGKLGITYKVILQLGPVLVVKRLRNMNGVSRKEFVQQMQLLGKLKHENLVEIISYCYSKDEKLVIYEHVPGGSLFQLLHDYRGEGRVALNWKARLSIVHGIARGLAYLHHSLPSHKVPHGNLKSSNVVMVHNHHPKLVDFGFLPLLRSPSHACRLAIGKAPEFIQGKKLTPKADVYCFGVILLEVITGHVPSDDDGEDLSEWVRAVVSSDWSTDILDLQIVAEKEGHGDMLKLTEIALECTALDPERCPKMSEVVKKIEEIIEARVEMPTVRT